MNISMKEKQIHRHREQTCGWEFKISRCKLLYVCWMDIKVLLYNTRNYNSISWDKSYWEKYEKYLYVQLSHLLYSGKHNIVNQLYLNKNFFKVKRFLA